MKRTGRVVFSPYRKMGKDGHVKTYYKATVYISKLFCDILDIKHGERYAFHLNLDKIAERELGLRFGDKCDK